MGVNIHTAHTRHIFLGSAPHVNVASPMECLHFAICYSTFFTISFKCSIAEHFSTFGEKWAFSEIQPH